MSREKEIQVCKWLVGQKLLSKEDAKKALQKQAALAKKGKKVSIITVLLKTDCIDEDTADKAKKKMTSGSSPAKKEVNTEQKVKKTKKKAPPPPIEDDEDEDSQDDSVSHDSSVDTIIADDDGRVKTCPECSSIIPLSAKECQICAAPQALVSTVHCPTCHRIGSSNDKHCHFCGCDIIKGSPGPNSLKCGGCKNVVLPDEAICKICGEVQSKVRTSSVSKLGKTVLASTLFVCYAALAFGMFTIANEGGVKKRTTQANVSKPIVQMDDTPIEIIESNEATQQTLSECLELAKKGQWKSIVEKIDQANKEGNIDEKLLKLWGNAYVRDRKLEHVVLLQKRARDNAYLSDIASESLIKLIRTKVIKEKDYDGALELADACLALNENYAKGLFWYGVIQYKKGNSSDAEKALTKATKIDNNRYDAFFMLYLLNRNDGDNEQAQRHLKIFKSNAQSNASLNDFLKTL